MLFVTPEIQIPETEFEFTFSRSSGPGGQNVNKVNSKVTLRWSPMASSALSADVRARFVRRFGSKLTTEGDLVIASQSSRDQQTNRQTCLEKLGQMLREVAYPPKTRRKTKPTRSSKVRRFESKRKHGEKKKNRVKFRPD